MPDTASEEVWFYHLERSTLEQVLPDLLQRTLKRGWRALVRTGDPERLEMLDNLLWTFRDETFLPHGVEGEGDEARQPVLLTTSDDNLNRAQALFLVDGAEAGGLDGFERRIDLFDGRDEVAVAAARLRWRAAKASGAVIAYWRQTEQGWEKQA